MNSTVFVTLQGFGWNWGDNMIDIYEFIETCKENGLSTYEAQIEYGKAVEEERERRLEEYYNDPIVGEGWRQQDIIDMYRMER